MSFFFLLNNLHFTVEVLGVLTFFLVSWLAFDAWRIRPDFLTVSRGIGFLLLAGGTLIHAVNFEGDFTLYIGAVLYALGLLFVILNMILEAPVRRPEFKAGVLLPAFSGIALGYGWAQFLGHATIAVFALRQYRNEFKKMLIPFWLGFLALTVSSLAGVYVKAELFDGFWIFEHFVKFLGFAGIAVWVWQYLKTRVKEELLIIFVGFSLFMAVIISLTFSSILISRIENSVMLNLRTDVRLLDYSIKNLGFRASAEAELASRFSGLADLIRKNKFEELASFAGEFKSGRNLGLVSIINAEGDVLARVGNVIRSRENIFSDPLFKTAMGGSVITDMGRGGGEDFSVRAYAPIYDVKGKISGVVIAGFLLDDAFVDSIKTVTGLDSSIFERETRIATTLFSADGKHRLTGMQEADKTVLERVLKQGSGVATRTRINSRPSVAAFLPIKNASGEAVGMVSISRYEQEIFKTAEATNRLTLLVTMIIMVILTLPIYFITKRLSEEG